MTDERWMPWLSFRRSRLLIAPAFVILMTLAWYYWTSNRSVESLLKDAQRRLDRLEFDEAESLARRALQQQPNDSVAALLAARAAVGNHRDADALEYLRFAAKTDANCIPCLRLGAEISQRAGRARDAELFLNRLVEINPRDIDAANQLAYLLGVEGRAFEALRPLFLALQTGRFTSHHLIMLAAGEPVVHDKDFVERCRQAVPDDPLPLLGLAREALGAQEFDSAMPLLQQIVRAVPESQEAQCRWGSFLQQRGLDDEFIDWHHSLPTDIGHPEIWVVRGHWARGHAEPQVAARCFWEALRLDPNHRVACYQLGQVLQETGRNDLAQPCFKRAALLEQLAYLVDRIYENPQAVELMAEAATLNESLGRIWEAWGWACGQSLSDPGNEAARMLMNRLRADLHERLPRTLDESQLGKVLDLSELPLPQWKARTSPPTGHQAPTAATVRFEDVADQVGLHFRYDNGHDPQSETTRMLESMGGGVAVLDFDLDGWPDLYLTQAGRWELAANERRPPDCLFRNLQGERFENITESSGLGDRDFSQGCAVGDFNGDGFPDLYVANIGRNRLYQNQGDGTFVDVTDAAGITSERWTTSCLLADINGDGLPDLYDVNYLSIQQAPRTLCVRGDEARTCSPGAFHAEPDQLYLNQGDGRFEDITVAAGIDVPNGKGLGIVAADFAEVGSINLFIANDSVPNFYFVNQAPSGAAPRFSEDALTSGLALSHDGLSAAWMGVAAGDANGDGRLDLFSTTYADQAKSLFLQEPVGGAFSDAIVSSGMNAATWKLLGFGTQFIDGELDGWPDLVMTNGHVFDLSHRQQAYQMPAQYFRNNGHAKFEEVAASQLGEFFERKNLGRGLAKLDWNRDGLQDFAVSNMLAPAGLVTNRTPDHGHHLTLCLVGSHSSRDAIGTRVTLKSGTREWTQQLTAGDGYQASNERKLHFGLGPLSAIDSVTVTWLHGGSITLTDLTVDQEWLLIENQSRAHRLPK